MILKKEINLINSNPFKNSELNLRKLGEIKLNTKNKRRNKNTETKQNLTTINKKITKIQITFQLQIK